MAAHPSHGTSFTAGNNETKLLHHTRIWRNFCKDASLDLRQKFCFQDGSSSSRETKSISSIKILPKDIQGALSHWDTAGLRLVVAARASVTRDWPSERLPLNCAKRAGPHSRPGVHRWARPLRLACTALSPADRPDLLPSHPPLTPVTLPGHHSTAGTHNPLLQKLASF